MELTKAYKVVRPSVVSISRLTKIDDKTIINPIGTGVCIDDKGYIVTAFHVIKSLLNNEDKEGEFVYNIKPDLDIVFTKQKYREAKSYIVKPLILLGSTESDIAILKVPNKFENKDGTQSEIKWPTINLPTIYNNAPVGTDIATIGFPLRNNNFTKALPDLYKGIVSRIDYSTENNDYSNIMLDINVHVGNSGGPVFSVKNAELIGIILDCHRTGDSVFNYDSEEIIIGQNEYFRDTTMINCAPWSQIHPLYIKLKNRCEEIPR